MKKRAIIVLCLALVLTLIGCGNNAQSSDEHNAEYEEGYTAGYEAGYHDGEEQATGNEKHFAQFSGSFTATVEQILPDYYALPGKTVAVVHFFQDRPFLLHFQKDLTGELIEGTACLKKIPLLGFVQIGQLHSGIECNFLFVYHVQQFRDKAGQADKSLDLRLGIIGFLCYFFGCCQLRPNLGRS